MTRDLSQRLQSPMLQMAALAGTHFMVDLIGGILPGILPVALTHFNISLGIGVVVLTCVSIGSNLLQIPAAQFDKLHSGPRMLFLGLAMASLIVLLGFLPTESPTLLLCGLMLVVGIGIAIVHPFGLRGVQSIERIAHTVTTPTFMVGGFLGYAAGPFIGAMLVEGFGLKGLLLLLIPIGLLVAVLRLGKIRLAVENGVKNAAAALADDRCRWSFRHLFIIALFLNSGSTIIQALLPSYLHAAGFSLSFGGVSAMLFGIGSAGGSLAIGLLTKRFRPSRFVIGGLALGIPTVIAYLLFSSSRSACVLMFLAGLFASSSFPLIVAMARSAANGPALGTRMGVIVGGTWGVAGLFLLLAGQAASRIGIAPVMNLAWIFYIIALAAALWRKPQKRVKN